MKSMRHLLSPKIVFTSFFTLFTIIFLIQILNSYCKMCTLEPSEKRQVLYTVIDSLNNLIDEFETQECNTAKRTSDLQCKEGNLAINATNLSTILDLKHYKETAYELSLRDASDKNRKGVVIFFERLATYRCHLFIYNDVKGSPIIEARMSGC